LFETDDLLLGCQPWKADLLCAVETATAPRKLVAIDLGSGGRIIKFDPNPAFGRLRLGPVERLHWVNNQGIETFGDLVLPFDHRPETALPLVVVQYESRGFLRGGTGDEYPIHALAAAGFAVLSFSRPLDVSFILQRQGKAVPKDYVRTWRDRRSVHSSLVKGIAIVRKRITIRPDKIAITGLSDGASTAAFALANSHLFSTALLSTCCDDPRQWLSDLGSRYRAERLADGYPFPVQAHQHYWRKGILAMNAGRGCVSLLLQLADSEFRTALPTYEAWKAAGVPVELSIYPNETHLKWQAAHRLALYAKAVDWLSRWRQKDRLRCSPSDRDE
jgi:dipeptidyl aminopeptidase/acylaminoacyl peptidase